MNKKKDGTSESNSLQRKRTASNTSLYSLDSETTGKRSKKEIADGLTSTSENEKNEVDLDPPPTFWIGFGRKTTPSLISCWFYHIGAIM